MSDPQRTKLEPGVILSTPQRACFEVARYLGKGSFGEVYAARQLVYGRPFRTVALKLFPANYVTAANIAETFSDAMALLGMQDECPSPEVARHLVSIFDMGLVVPEGLQNKQSRAFISMKLIPGGNNVWKLAQRFPEGMPVPLTLHYLRQMLIPVAWMHARPTAIVHGDLKPDNVLLTEDSEIVVTDFGLAARMPVGSHGGAIAYQAPELLLANLTHTSVSEAFGLAMDVYALGIMWYEMLTGRHPFDEVDALVGSGHEIAQMRAHLEARKRPIKPACSRNQELKEHPQLEAILKDCLAERPSARIPTAAVLLEKVDRYIASGRIEMPGLEPKPHTTPPPPAARSIDALIADADALVRTRKPEHALRLLVPLVERAVLAQGRALLAAGRATEARSACSQLPRSAEVLEFLAETLEKLDKRELAHSHRLEAQKLRAGFTR